MLQKNKGNSHFTLFAGLYARFCRKKYKIGAKILHFTFYMQCVFEPKSHKSDESLFVSSVLFVFKNNCCQQSNIR